MKKEMLMFLNSVKKKIDNDSVAQNKDNYEDKGATSSEIGIVAIPNRTLFDD